MDDLIPILGILFVIGPPATWMFSLTPIGKAIAHRLKGGPAEDDGRLEELQNTLYDMQDLVERMGEEMGDLQERVSFAERMITSGKKREATPV